MMAPYCERCDLAHLGGCQRMDIDLAEWIRERCRFLNDVAPFTNFELPAFLAAQHQAANHNAEQRLREKAREEESFYRVYAPWRLQLNAAIDANASDLRPVQRDYVSAAQRDQARLRAVDVV